jgi:hypothetical protein
MSQGGANMNQELLQILEQAVGEPDARIIVRNESAIAELVGPLPLRATDEWLTLGMEGQPHVHLRCGDLRALRLDAPSDGNVAIEVVSLAGARIARVAFSRTNPDGKAFDAARRAALVDRYGALA